LTPPEVASQPSVTSYQAPVRQSQAAADNTAGKVALATKQRSQITRGVEQAA